MGVIDAVSKTLKNKIFKYLTAKNTTNWIDHLQAVVTAYNDTPHSALDFITPNEAKHYKMDILLLNIKKNKSIPPTSYKPGNLVRKRLKKPVFSKGYKQSWSDSTYTISQVNGVNAILDNNENVKLNDLQVISHATNQEQKEFNKEARKEEKQAKVQKKVKQEGLQIQDILPRRILTRERKPTNQVIDDRYGKVNY